MAADAALALLAAGADAKKEAAGGATPLTIATSGDPDDSDDLGFGDLVIEEDGAPAPEDPGPLPRRNYHLIDALVAAGAGEPAAFCWTSPDLERHDFTLKPLGGAASWATGQTVEVRVSAALDAFSSDESGSDDDEAEIVEAVGSATLLERRGDAWRCYLAADVLSEKAPQLMLLRGRELAIDASAS